MKKNKNVDILRAVAILIIIIYHCYVLTGMPWSEHTRLNTMLSFGGEFGVTLFFVLSGFGIYWSLQHKDESGNFPGWIRFMKQRCFRILPQYYACIAFLLIFQSTGMIGISGLKHILSYVFMAQNLSVSTHGSINGALWALATIFQFYLVAPILYRLIKKSWKITGIAAIVLTVGSKFLFYHLLFPLLHLEGSAYFVYGRQLLTALDNFVIGMIAAKLVICILRQWSTGRQKSAGIAGGCASVVTLIGVSYYFAVRGIYGDTVLAYSAHSILAILMGIMLVFVAIIPQNYGPFTKPFSFIAKYQYGMYLWHMPIIGYLYNGSPLFQTFASINFLVFVIGVLIIVTIVGYFTTMWVDSMNYSEWLRRFKVSRK